MKNITKHLKNAYIVGGIMLLTGCATTPDTSTSNDQSLTALPVPVETKIDINDIANISTTGSRTIRKILPPLKYRDGIVINIPEKRLYLFSKDHKFSMSYPVAVGRKDWRTPLMNTYVSRMRKNPPWYPPQSIKDYTLKKSGRVLPSIVKAGPDNPLGARAIYLGVPSYLIHGNNRPSSIGRFASSGCIRLHNRDVINLYNHVSKDMPVYIIYRANKLGWQGNKLMLESYRKVDSAYYKDEIKPIKEEILHFTKGHLVKIDWNTVRKTVKRHKGTPIVIGTIETDQLPTDQLPTDQLPTDQLPTDQLPTDQLPTDQLPNEVINQLINSTNLLE